jgi:hypothetical protein
LHQAAHCRVNLIAVIPAKAGIQPWRLDGCTTRPIAASMLDSHMRGNDEWLRGGTCIGVVAARFPHPRE